MTEEAPIPDSSEEETSHTLPAWVTPLIPTAVALLVAVTSYVNAHTARVENQVAQDQLEETVEDQESFQSQVESARTSDEEALNAVVELCYQNDRLLRFYAQRIESNLYSALLHSRTVEGDQPIQWAPAEFPGLTALEEEGVETLAEKLERAYSDDELIEAIRLIELHSGNL